MTGRVALVTGAASGLGAATARRLAREGFAVCLADIDIEGCGRVAESLSGTGHCLMYLDVFDEGSVEAAFEGTEARIGPVGALVCCAGGSSSRMDRQPRLVDTTLEDWDRTEALNSRGAFLGVRDFLRRRMAEPLDHGRIVLVASTAAHRPAIAAGVSYSVAKAGVLALMRAAAIEAAPLRVTVNAVSPGAFDTPAFHAVTSASVAGRQIAGIPIGRIGDPAEFAALVAFLLSPEAGYITGATLDINGGVRMA